MNKAGKLMSIFLLTLMGLSLFGFAGQPMMAYAKEKAAVETAVNPEKDIFKDFNVTIGDEPGKIDVITATDGKGAWGTLIEKYKGFITGIAAVGAVTMVVLFILQFLKLGTSAGNPKARSEALVGVLWTGIAAAGLGAVALITGVFYNAIV